MVKDLVCGSDVDREKAASFYYDQGHLYYFCPPECRDKFAEGTLPGINS